MGKGEDPTAQIVMEHYGDIGSTKRPQHAAIWPAVNEFPLTRVAKVDELALQ